MGTAVVKFEQGEMRLDLRPRGEDLVWVHGAEQFGNQFATVEVALQFLKDFCELYNHALDMGCNHSNLEQPQGELQSRRASEGFETSSVLTAQGGSDVSLTITTCPGESGSRFRRRPRTFRQKEKPK